MNPSLERTVIVLRFLSRLCDSLLAEAQFNTKFVVGTISTFVVYGLIGYFPGFNGSAKTPFCPSETRLPCLNVDPVTSIPFSPKNDITTATLPIGTSVIGTSSTETAQGFRL